ncbi:MAG TPA: ribokinase [Homoserinimonas sp.]|nr:ribokinase [Homoserinimonas sp.]
MSPEHPVHVVIVGSANMDVVFSVDRMPAPGETLLADSAQRHPGGKGLNQAVASARSGAQTTFIGALGTDPFGDTLADAMESAGVSRELVRRSDRDTGQAFILVDQAAENMIVVASGANATMTELTGQEQEAIIAAQVLLMQLELPTQVVLQAAATAKAAGRAVMLNAAPAAPLGDELLALLDYLIVNEHEACLIGGSEDLATASLALAAKVDHLIVTLGAQGSQLYKDGVVVGTVTPPKVTAVDTTGAGDTFCGAFATAVAEGLALQEAVRFATAASALSVESVGAVSSIPSRSSIETKLGERW